MSEEQNLKKTSKTEQIYAERINEIRPLVELYSRGGNGLVTIKRMA